MSVRFGRVVEVTPPGTFTQTGQFWPTNYDASMLLGAEPSNNRGGPTMIAYTDFVFAGAQQYSGIASNAGQANIITASTMVEAVAHEPTVANTGAGSAFAVNSTHYAVGFFRGTTTSGTRSGYVDIYDRTHTLVTQIIPPVPPIGVDTTLADDYFGGSLAMNENYIAIGHYGLDDPNSTSGVVHIYDTATYTHQLMISNPSLTGNTGDRFGRSLAVIDNKVIIGASESDEYASNSGIAYIYNMDTGALLQTYSTSSQAANLEFGFSVAANSNYFAICCPGTTSNADDNKIYVYNKSTYALVYTIDGTLQMPASQGFGTSLSMNDSYLVVGAENYTGTVAGEGQVLIYNANNGNYISTVTSPITTEAANFGAQVSIASDNKLYVSAPRATYTATNDIGTVYQFTLT